MSKNIRVLHLSTHNEECGIAIYQENIVRGMQTNEPTAHIKHEFFPVSPNKLRQMDAIAFDQQVSALLDQLSQFDILHIQHEYSFYASGQLGKIVAAAKSLNKKVLVTLHTPPHAHRGGPPQLARYGLNPRNWVHTYRQRVENNRFYTDYIEPLSQADLLVATSNVSIESFQAYGLNRDVPIGVIELPVPEIDKSVKTNEISTKLSKNKGDVLLSMVGFISATKGTRAAVKALTYLPSNYKLALIGGSHPSGQNDAYFDEIADLIRELGLRERVYITGYVENDTVRDAYVRETDVCLYPYDKAYYDYVSSAALTNAIANNVPIVAYKTKTFIESSKDIDFIQFTQSANYYELARVVREIDGDEARSNTVEYANQYSVKKQAALFANVYKELTNGL